MNPASFPASQSQAEVSRPRPISLHAKANRRRLGAQILEYVDDTVHVEISDTRILEPTPSITSPTTFQRSGSSIIDVFLVSSLYEVQRAPTVPQPVFYTPEGVGVYLDGVTEMISYLEAQPLPRADEIQRVARTLPSSSSAGYRGFWAALRSLRQPTPEQVHVHECKYQRET
jgi:hypothetical protein